MLHLCIGTFWLCVITYLPSHTAFILINHQVPQQRFGFSACHVCVQGKAGAADLRVVSMANLVPKAAPKPMFNSNLEADLAEKAMQLKQMAAKDGCYEDAAYKSLLREVEKLEGQVGCLISKPRFWFQSPNTPSMASSPLCGSQGCCSCSMYIDGGDAVPISSGPDITFLFVCHGPYSSHHSAVVDTRMACCPFDRMLSSQCSC